MNHSQTEQKVRIPGTKKALPDHPGSGFIPVMACLLWLLLFHESSAQSIPTGDPFEFYTRVLQLSDTTYSGPSFNIRPITKSHIVNQLSAVSYQQSLRHPWANHSFFAENLEQRLTIYAPKLTTTWNSSMPSGQNDGAMWQGKGLNTAFSLGAFAALGPLEVAFRPEFGHSRNRDFGLSPLPAAEGLSEYAYPSPRNVIDYPQRFGDEPYSWFHPGQSFARLRYKAWSAGVSTANMWTGPAIHNPVLFSNNAPGFFHAFIGTVTPARTPIGKVEGKLFWGSTRESGYYDDNSDNNRLFIPGIILNYSPSFIPGLHLGGIRTYYQYYPPGGISFSDITRIVEPFTKENFSTEENPTGNDQASQMLSIFGRWVHPGSGFETYFEWGRNDHALDMRDVSGQPEHSRAFVLGFLKTISLPQNRLLAVNTEITHLERSRTLHTRDYPTWYQHHIIQHGFTNRGQVIGSGIGPGSNSQLIRVQLYDAWGLGGISLNRVEHQNDRLERHFAVISDLQEESKLTFADLQEVEFRLGLHAVIFLPRRLELQADFYQSKFFNRHNMYEETAGNTNIGFTLRYRIE